MPVLATARFFVKPEKVPEFLDLLAAILPDTRGFEGCEFVDTYVDQDEPGHVLLLEQWDERASHLTYLRWRSDTGMIETMAPFITARPEFTYFDARPAV